MRYLQSEPTGFGYRDPANGTYTIDEGVLVDPAGEIKRTDRLSRELFDAEHRLFTQAPEFRGGGCTQAVDTSVHVRYTTPRRTA